MKQKRGLYVLVVVVVLAIVAALVFWPKQEEESVGESPVHTVDDLAGASIGVYTYIYWISTPVIMKQRDRPSRGIPRGPMPFRR